jgi:hypothetical protein
MGQSSATTHSALSDTDTKRKSFRNSAESFVTWGSFPENKALANFLPTILHFPLANLFGFS